MRTHRTIHARAAAAFLFILLCVSCSGRNVRSAPPATQGQEGNPSTGQKLLSTPTIALPTLALNQGTLSPTGSPPGQWKTRTDQESGVSYSYPGEWSEKESGYLEGADGFAWLENIPGKGAGPGAVCQGEANRGKPARFGAYPEIVDLDNRAKTACLILSSPDQPAERKGESLFILWVPQNDRPDTLLLLHADRDHIRKIADSLQPTRAAASEPKGVCDFDVKTLTATSLKEGGLRMDEFPVARSADCSPEQEAEKFSEITGAGEAASQTKQLYNSQWQGSRLSRLNKRLVPFGYRVLAANNLYKIYRNGKALRSNINWLGQLTVNASETDFLLPIKDSYDGKTYQVRRDGLHDLDSWDLLLYDQVFPIFVGDDLISLEYDYSRYARPSNSPALVNVRKNSELIQTVSVSGSSPAGGPVRGLWSWDSHWMLVLPGLVLKDGISLNDELGADEVFSWRLIQGRPFYFFRKNGQVQASYDLQNLSLTYDEVIYQPQQGLANLIQMRSYEDGLAFYARRGGIWYYVVLSAI